ncbi:hypothetical protein EST38_g6024 [Candolleomyces aberdarensis]|uniref:Uncharacterized protein n=1 Tax=Candolleomyces aberdarensis TaxID=2316362 RepID=A0A4Q2DJ35_9AGAR|nr:hypothetical protein EST38_g6024 [Candolleomyces aberdarensis]
MKQDVEQWVANREKELPELVERDVLAQVERERIEEEEQLEAEEREREQRERELREKERESRVRKERKDGSNGAFTLLGTTSEILTGVGVGTRVTKTPLEEVKNTLPYQPVSRKDTTHETLVSTTATTRRTPYNSHTNGDVLRVTSEALFGRYPIILSCSHLPTLSVVQALARLETLGSNPSFEDLRDASSESEQTIQGHLAWQEELTSHIERLVAELESTQPTSTRSEFDSLTREYETQIWTLKKNIEASESEVQG